ncbi:MAG: DUF3788 family protein [Bacteroidota bacterium]
MSSAYSDQKEAAPDESKLKKALGELHFAYKEVLELTEAYDHEWKYYGKKCGWQLKVTQKGKALLYLTPLERSFKIGFGVRENERERLLNSSLPPKTKEELAAAKKYPEGYPLRLEIKSKTDMRTVRTVIEVLKESRSS